MLPSHSIRHWDPVSSASLRFCPVRLIFMREPAEKGLFVLINAPDADIFLVTKANTCFLLDVIVSNRAGNSMINRSYLRLSIGNRFFLGFKSVNR